mmetsp:Transcript_12728/g.17389  ORF Transcript_12728/g.17389 Transcript_12728/m.17389 type:complete len:572 (+) Transcript_12728:214-1929(+)
MRQKSGLLLLWIYFFAFSIAFVKTQDTQAPPPPEIVVHPTYRRTVRIPFDEPADSAKYIVIYFLCAAITVFSCLGICWTEYQYRVRRAEACEPISEEDLPKPPNRAPPVSPTESPMAKEAPVIAPVLWTNALGSSQGSGQESPKTQGKNMDEHIRSRPASFYTPGDSSVTSLGSSSRLGNKASYHSANSSPPLTDRDANDPEALKSYTLPILDDSETDSSPISTPDNAALEDAGLGGEDIFLQIPSPSDAAENSGQLSHRSRTELGRAPSLSMSMSSTGDDLLLQASPASLAFAPTSSSGESMRTAQGPGRRAETSAMLANPYAEKPGSPSTMAHIDRLLFSFEDVPAYPLPASPNQASHGPSMAEQTEPLLPLAAEPLSMVKKHSKIPKPPLVEKKAEKLASSHRRIPSGVSDSTAHSVAKPFGSVMSHGGQSTQSSEEDSARKYRDQFDAESFGNGFGSTILMGSRGGKRGSSDGSSSIHQAQHSTEDYDDFEVGHAPPNISLISSARSSIGTISEVDTLLSHVEGSSMIENPRLASVQEQAFLFHDNIGPDDVDLEESESAHLLGKRS